VKGKRGLTAGSWSKQLKRGKVLNSYSMRVADEYAVHPNGPYRKELGDTFIVNFFVGSSASFDRTF
jgi:hypothetical protein